MYIKPRRPINIKHRERSGTTQGKAGLAAAQRQEDTHLASLRLRCLRRRWRGDGGRPAGCGGDVGADAAAADAGAGCPVGSAAVVVVMVGAGVGVGVGGWGCGCGSWGEGLHVDLRVWLGRGVVGLRARVVLGAQLHGGAHGDLRLLGEAVAAVGRRHAAKRARRRAVAAAVRAVHVGLGLDLDHPVGTRTVGRETINTYI